ncbi:30S ribosomal protein S2 [Candidatus Microgenomates bacterium]|nr:30S ribosomal protein S2 [Candidatus Microgenomates bacterium]
MPATQPSVAEVTKLFEAELHLGHKRNRLHPKARKFVYKIENGTSIIDLTQTVVQIAAAKAYLKKAKEENKSILVVATKKVASAYVSELCKKEKIPYITTKWLPGLLTNFQTIIKNVKKMNEMRIARDENGWDNLTKHERVQNAKYVAKLEKFYAGIADLTKKPDVLLILDIRKEHNAVDEAKKTGVTIVAVTDTNTDPESVDYPMVANDDSPKAIEYLVSDVLGSYTKAEVKEAK